MWVWVDSGSWWWTGRPGVLRFMGSQIVRHDWATELSWTEWVRRFFQSRKDQKHENLYKFFIKQWSLRYIKLVTVKREFQMSLKHKKQATHKNQKTNPSPYEAASSSFLILLFHFWSRNVIRRSYKKAPQIWISLRTALVFVIVFILVLRTAIPTMVVDCWDKRMNLQTECSKSMYCLGYRQANIITTSPLRSVGKKFLYNY